MGFSCEKIYPCNKKYEHSLKSLANGFYGMIQEDDSDIISAVLRHYFECLNGDATLTMMKWPS